MTFVSNEDIYKTLLNFKGYGNPKGKYWFIGQEENWNSDGEKKLEDIFTEKVYKWYKDSIQPINMENINNIKDIAKKHNTFYQGIYRLLSEITGINNVDELFDKFKEEIFVTNVKFMPFTEYDMIKRHFPFKEKSDYLIDEKKHREELLKLLNDNYVPKRMIFCLSANYYKEMLSLFDIKESLSNQFWNDRYCYGQNKDQIIFFFYHPSSWQNKFEESLDKFRLFKIELLQ